MSFRIAVVGAGRMGKLHARVLGEMQDVELVGVVDANLATADAVARQRNCKAFSDPAQVVDLVDAAIISVPTLAHVQAARPFVAAGKSVLIEKPITNEIAAGKELIDLARSTGSRVQVGHTERFNPAVLALKKFEIRPKFIEAQRISPFTFRSADVGVVLDMMIHDIDLVLMLVAAPVSQVSAVGVNVIGKHEDICNARLIFANGCVANLTASRLAIKTERKMRIFSEEAYLSVDYAKKVGVAIRKQSNMDIIQMAKDLAVEDLAELAQQIDYTKLLKVEELKVDESTEPLKLQAQAFIQAVKDKSQPVVSAEAGLAAVQVAKDIVDSIAHHKWDGDASNREGLNIIRK